MKKKVFKISLYDVNWYRDGFCYRTTINVTSEQVKEMKKLAKMLGETIKYEKSGTKEVEYYV